MGEWPSIDFRSVFVMDVSPLEVVLRGTLVYLGLVVLMRVIPKRHAGSLSPNDVALVVVVGGVAVAAMAKEFMSVPGVLLLILTILGWNYALDWLGHRFPRLRPLLREPPARLLQDGRVLHRNLRREFVTEEELMAELRKQGVRDVADVREACLEADGNVSVVRKDDRPAGAEAGGRVATAPDQGQPEAAKPAKRQTRKRSNG